MDDESHNTQKETTGRSFEINVGKDLAGIGAIVAAGIPGVSKLIKWLNTRKLERHQFALENAQKISRLLKECGYSTSEIQQLMEPLLMDLIEASRLSVRVPVKNTRIGSKALHSLPNRS